MSDVLFLYLFTRLDDVRAVLVWFGFVSLIGSVGWVIAALIRTDKDDPEHMRKATAIVSVFRAFAIVGFVMVGIRTAIPSKTDMAIIVGGKVTLDAARSDTGKEIAGEVMDAVRAQLKKAAK